MNTAQFLKTYTSLDHEELDKLVNLDPKLSGARLKATYGHLLKKTYRFLDIVEAPLNAYLAQQPHWQHGMDRKALIAKDLDDLGVSLPRRESPKTFADLTEAVGFLYVLEGSALGGRVIFKRLSRVPEVADRCQFHFHSISATALSKRWVHILACLDAWIDETDYQATGEAARDAFLMFRTFFQELCLEKIERERKY